MKSEGQIMKYVMQEKSKRNRSRNKNVNLQMESNEPHLQTVSPNTIKALTMHSWDWPCKFLQFFVVVLLFAWVGNICLDCATKNMIVFSFSD